jgi:hypothetical protein
VEDDIEVRVKQGQIGAHGTDIKAKKTLHGINHPIL